MSYILEPVDSVEILTLMDNSTDMTISLDSNVVSIGSWILACLILSPVENSVVSRQRVVGQRLQSLRFGDRITNAPIFDLRDPHFRRIQP